MQGVEKPAAPDAIDAQRLVVRNLCDGPESERGGVERVEVGADAARTALVVVADGVELLGARVVCHTPETHAP